MNILRILSEMEKVDPEVYERFDSRRRVFKHIAGLGKQLSAAALPLALGSIFNKAYGQSGGLSVTDVLNFALKLEYLESYFYDAGLGIGGATATAAQTALRAQFSATNLTALDKIRTDEANHVTFLRQALGNNAIAVPARTQFDFTGKRGATTGVGPFETVFSSAAVFLAVAQSLEDTGVRAYKGGAPLLMSDKTVLEAALNIHSVEARHASRLRTMRRGLPNNNAASQVAATGNSRGSSPKSWISGNDGGGAQPAQTAPIYGAGAPAADYPADDNVTQGGVNLQTALASLNFPAVAFSEAFDEPLDPTTVSGIARTFTIASSTLF